MEKVENPGNLEFSPRNIFFVLMGDFVQNLLLNLPSRVVNSVLEENRIVLFQSKALLENATRLLEAEDYFTCGDLRYFYERFCQRATPIDSKMDLLVSISGTHFWRVIKGPEKEPALQRIKSLVPAALALESSPRRLLFLLAAHRILHALDASLFPLSQQQQEEEDPSVQEAEENNGLSFSALQIEEAILDELNDLSPSSIPLEFSQNFKQIFRSFVHFVVMNRNNQLFTWPASWNAQIEEFLKYLPPQQKVSFSLSSSTTSSSSSSSSSTTTTTDLSSFEPIQHALEDEDLFVASRLLTEYLQSVSHNDPCQETPEAIDSDDTESLQALSQQLGPWVTQFLELYRQRFDYVCPFALSMESFQLGEDGQEPNPILETNHPEQEEEQQEEEKEKENDEIFLTNNDPLLFADKESTMEEVAFYNKKAEIHVYRLSTGTLISEFGRRGLGLTPLQKGEEQSLTRYQPRDPTNRHPVTSYRRDELAEHHVAVIFARLRYLHRLVAQLSQQPRKGDDSLLISKFVALLHRYLQRFDTSFLEVKLRLLE